MKKVLVANRGEIALRIMRTLKEWDIATLAVFSEADRMSPHVRYADQAVCIGPPPSAQSYLLADKIVATALQSGVDAIHPGYGFLSENADFARKVEAAGITFIGPPPHAIEVMGSKLAAKAAVAQYKIPMVPGTEHALASPEEAERVANAIGYPVLIKASAGGGGKGMRIVERAGDLREQMQRAVSEAQAAFGDGSVFIEKYVKSPRHIEIQILADKHGNVVHLFERECSIQRRHQKVVEEAPSPVLTPALRRAMGESAKDVARACSYTGAGTVEFLLDADHNYYFLEMNTRLQVEHPVTEMITGIDLVKAQIDIADGKPLPFSQGDLQINGHSIELRVYAEDPANNFLPDIGRLKTYRPPQGPGVRVDDGFEQGMDIPIYYDPMIAKLIVHAADRQQAIRKMLRAIDEYRISGVANTLAFGKYVMQHQAFASGNFDTHFVKNHYDPAALQANDPAEAELAALIAIRHFNELKQRQSPAAGAGTPSGSPSKWKANRLGRRE